MVFDQYTNLYGVMGNPIGHSLSPAIHNAAISVYGLNAVYLAFEVKDVEPAIMGMKALGINGMSVTIPHKTTVIPLLDELDEAAREIGAVNTIVNDRGRLLGYNTDAPGALKSIEGKVALYGKTCLILGAGGAGRAIGYILKKNGAEVVVSNRSVDVGEALALYLDCPFVPLNELENARCDVLIHNTPVGMMPRTDECIVPESMLQDGMVVMDVVYNPLETKLLKLAKTRGCVTIDGLGMFIHQGAEQFRLWNGLEPPISQMTRAAEKALESQRQVS
jgi:shikimate dehydrogenase